MKFIHSFLDTDSDRYRSANAKPGRSGQRLLLLILALVCCSGCRFAKERLPHLKPNFKIWPAAKIQNEQSESAIGDPLADAPSQVEPAAYVQQPAAPPLAEPPPDQLATPQSPPAYAFGDAPAASGNYLERGPTFRSSELDARRENPATRRVVELGIENQQLKDENLRLHEQLGQTRRSLTESVARIDALESWVSKLQQQLKTERLQRSDCQMRIDEITQRVFRTNELRQRQISELIGVIEDLEQQLNSRQHGPSQTRSNSDELNTPKEVPPPAAQPIKGATTDRLDSIENTLR